MDQANLYTLFHFQRQKLQQRYRLFSLFDIKILQICRPDPKRTSYLSNRLYKKIVVLKYLYLELQIIADYHISLI